MKELSRLGLYQPRPEVPFTSLSFNNLCDLVRDIRDVQWSIEGNWNEHPCTLRAAITTLIKDVSTAIGGLNLGDLKKTRDS
jgi:hypothetical protein